MTQDPRFIDIVKLPTYSFLGGLSQKRNKERSEGGREKRG